MALAAAMLLHAASADDQACIIPVTLTSSSGVKIAGVIKKPFTADVVPPAKITTFTGGFAVVIPGACPAADKLSSALAKAYVATPKDSAGVSMGTTNTTVEMAGTPIASMLVKGLRGTVLSRPGPQGVASPNVTATDGVVLPNSAVLPMPPYPLKGEAMKMEGSGCKLTARNAEVSYTCPSVQVNQPVNLTIGYGNLKITGAMIATGKLSGAKTVAAKKAPAPMA